MVIILIIFGKTLDLKFVRLEDTVEVRKLEGGR